MLDIYKNASRKTLVAYAYHLFNPQTYNENTIPPNAITVQKLIAKNFSFLNDLLPEFICYTPCMPRQPRTLGSNRKNSACRNASIA
jgi:hypothetical protein